MSGFKRDPVFGPIADGYSNLSRARANRLLDEAKALEAGGALDLAIAKRNEADAALSMSYYFGGLSRHVQ